MNPFDVYANPIQALKVCDAKCLVKGPWSRYALGAHITMLAGRGDLSKLVRIYSEVGYWTDIQYEGYCHFARITHSGEGCLMSKFSNHCIRPSCVIHSFEAWFANNKGNPTSLARFLL